jgi:hypothetical protein
MGIRYISSQPSRFFMTVTSNRNGFFHSDVNLFFLSMLMNAVVQKPRTATVNKD